MGDERGSISHILLQSNDFDRLEAFYTDVVGFHVKEREPFPDGRRLVVMEERLGITELAEPRSTAGQAVEHVAFQVPDIDDLLTALDTHDVEIDDGPKETPYGTSVYFFDPDGNRIECHD